MTAVSLSQIWALLKHFLRTYNSPFGRYAPSRLNSSIQGLTQRNNPLGLGVLQLLELCTELHSRDDAERIAGS